MEAIRALQSQLQQVQKSSNVKKISERNCIDLVQHLIATEQVDLVHTSNGKEWLTPEQLDQEIQDVLACSGGRLNVTELPGEVGVPVEYCESRVELLRKRDTSLCRIQGELLSSQYVQGVAQEIAESLEEAGCLAVADLASRHALAADFIREVVLPHVEAPGLVVKQHAIYTGTHAARVEARVRGALRGCTEPTSLAQFAGQAGQDSEMVLAAAQKALASGLISGKISSSSFIPQAFSEAQASKVDSFFQSNQYLLLSLAKSADVELKSWIKSRGVAGVSLRTAFISEQLLETVLGSVLEALAAESWIDLQPLLPPALADSDACDLLTHLESSRKLPPGSVQVGRLALSSGFIEGIASHLEAEVTSAAERLLSTPAQNRTAKKQSAAEEEEEEGSSKKKGKRAAKGKKVSARDEGPADSSAGAGESGVDDSAVLGLLVEKFPEIPEEAHGELLQRLQPILGSRVSQQMDALRSSLQSQQRAFFEQVERLVQERHEACALGFRALEATGLQETPLQQHHLRETVVEPLHRMLALRLQEVTGSTVEVTSANRKQSLDKLAAAEGSSKSSSLSKLLAALGKGKDKEKEKEAKEKEAKEKEKETKDKERERKSKGKKGDREADREDREEEEVLELPELYRAAAEDCHIFCRKVDKKREKAALQEKRAELREKLKDCLAADSGQVFGLGLQLTLLQEGVVGLLFPEEIWAFRLVTKVLADEAVRDKAEALCGLLESGENPVALQEAVEDWKEQALKSK